jgi:ATP-dependent helicase/nuclease subunit B
MYEPIFAHLDNGATLIAANQRLARTLTQTFSEQQLHSGQTAWASAHIYSWQEWLNTLWSDSRMQGGAASRLALLSDTDTAVLWTDIIAAELEQGTATAAKISELAKLAEKSWTSLNEWDALGATEWTSAGLTEDQQQFLRWSGKYRDRCAADKWIDKTQLPAALLADVSAGLFNQHGALVFVGFDEWSPAKQQLRDALTQQKITVTVELNTLPTAMQVSRLHAESDKSELELAAHWARARMEENSLLNVCVVVPDLATRAAEVRRVFLDVFAANWRSTHRSREAVNLSYGEALANKPRVASALNLLNLCQGIQNYTTISLALRSPFLKAGRAEAEQRAQLDLRLRERLGAEYFATEARPYAQTIAPDFATILAGIDAATIDLSKRSLASWADWITRFLQSAGWPGEDELDSVAFQEIDAWNRLLNDFAASSKIHSSIDFQTARSLLERLAWKRLHQPQGATGAVQIMGRLEAAGHQFDHLWVTGMAAEDWPAAHHPDPLIPYVLQRRCSMPGSKPDIELAQARAVTKRLALSAQDVIFSCAARRDGEALHPSQLIIDYPLADDSLHCAKSTWSQSLLGNAPLEIIRNDAPAPWPNKQPARGGARLFNLQGSCPLRAFLELRLGAVEIQPPENGLGYRERGSFAHQVLEDFYKEYPSSDALANLNSHSLAKHLRTICQRRMRVLTGIQRPFIRAIAELEMQRLLPLLSAFIEQDKARGPFEVIATELAQEVQVGPVIVRLKLDRLDQLQNGSRFVIDYKTGVVKRSSWNPGKPGDMQLPLYATFTQPEIDAVAFAQIAAQGVKFDGFGSNNADIPGVDDPADKATRFLDSDGDKIVAWDALKDEWQKCLLELAEGFAAGNCAINPRYPKLAEGQFAVLSRVYELPAGDEGDGGSGGG